MTRREGTQNLIFSKDEGAETRDLTRGGVIRRHDLIVQNCNEVNPVGLVPLEGETMCMDFVNGPGWEGPVSTINEAPKGLASEVRGVPCPYH